MVTDERVVSRFDSPSVLQAELADLQHCTLPMFVYPMFGVPLIWLIHAALRDWSQASLYLIDIAVIELVVAGFLVLEVRHTSYILAAWTFVLSLGLAICLLLTFQPDPVFVTLGLAVVIAAQALLGPAQSFLATALMWSAAIAAWRLRAGAYPAPLTVYGMLSLYALIWTLTWLSSHPLRTSVSWALAAWKSGRQLLEETRERRAELYRALRALEEATYRIERMNGELLVARHQADEAREQKSRFVATVSHELRGPLNLILGYSRLMVMSPERYGVALPPAYRADVATIYRNSQHLADLVDDILDLSQIEADHLPLVRDWIGLDEVIEDALSIVRPLARRKTLAMRVELADDLPPILADRVRLRQVLLNILTNAVRFTERGGIVVRTWREVEDIAISVQDTGPGIAQEMLPKLFHEFYQPNLPQEGEARGSGLGLSISKYLVELHGGRIWAESQAGIGTTIFFALPLPETSPSPSTVTRARQRSGRLNDDFPYIIAHADPAIVRLLARYLDGYRVIGVTDTGGVLPLVEELHPLAIVTQSSLAEPLQEQLVARGLDVPVIGCAMPHRSEGLGAALHYLTKPVSPEMVRAIMRQVERDEETVILLVDDDPDAVRLMETMLTALPYPYNILKAHDGLKALEIMRQTRPDIVFLDLLMPNVDGEQVLAHMRADKDLRGIPVVIVSAQDWLNDATVLGLPFSVHAIKSLSVPQVAGWLSTILREIRPDYLMTAGPAARPAEAIPG